MAFIHQDGALEPIEVQESVNEIVDQVNRAAKENTIFILFTDMTDEPVIIQVLTAYRITTDA